jgi:DNA (cytosine-5)-methyltransferase 1
MPTRSWRICESRWVSEALTVTNQLVIGDDAARESVQRRIEVGDRTYLARRGAPEAAANPTYAWMLAYLRGSPLEFEGEPSPPTRVAEMFCGSGGLALGFGEACRELGSAFDSRAAVDHDESAVEVYGANHNTAVRTARSATELIDYRVVGSRTGARFRYTPEIVEPTWADLAGQVDVLLAGPPCQGHSNLNNHSRRTDPRNDLYLTVPAMAVALDVDVVVIENVPAVVHDRSGVVESTETLLRAHGYQLTTGVVSASRIGWPQTRRRFFIVARRSAVPLDLEAVQRALEVPEPASVMLAIGDLQDRLLNTDLHLKIELSADNRRRIEWLFANDEHNLAAEERPDCHKDGTTYGAVYGRMYADRPAPTLTTGFLTPGRGRYIHPHLPRTITPHEAARIQGFPDGYKFRLADGSHPTKSKLTKWIGDAVPMPLGYVAGLSALGPGHVR